MQCKKKMVSFQAYQKLFNWLLQYQDHKCHSQFQLYCQLACIFNFMKAKRKNVSFFYLLNSIFNTLYTYIFIHQTKNSKNRRTRSVTSLTSINLKLFNQYFTRYWLLLPSTKHIEFIFLQLDIYCCSIIFFHYYKLCAIFK